MCLSESGFGVGAGTGIKDEIELEVYSDEINRVKLSADNSVWMYIGALFVPVEFKNYCLTTLNNLRCIKHGDWTDEESECTHQCGFHDKNSTEIHYNELHRSNARLRIAKNWIIQFANRESCQKHHKLVYLNILGLNLSNMDLELFGDDTDRDLTIYNRFYRTVLKGGIGYFFKKYGRVRIHKIYHDKGSQELHRLFPWHSIQRISLEDEKIEIEEEEITFIDSDHRKSGMGESHFIQLIDLLLGAAYVNLHNPSEKNEKREIGLAFNPVLKTLLDRKKNQDLGHMEGSYYGSNYYRAQQISFFPKKKMELDKALNQMDMYGCQVGESKKDRNDNRFYYDRPILLNDLSQTNLARWLG